MSSWYLCVFQSCRTSTSCVFSSSVSGILLRTVDVGQPNFPAGSRTWKICRLFWASRTSLLHLNPLTTSAKCYTVIHTC